MSVPDVAQGEVSAAPAGHHGHGAGALTAGTRALFAAVSGLVLTCGIGVVLWAVTPSSIGGSQQSLRAAVAAFAGGNGMTLVIGRSALTLPPLMVMVIAVGLLAGIAGGGHGAAADDRTGEITRTATAAAVYAAAVTTAGVVVGTPGTVAAEQWWRPFLLAFVVVGTTVFFRGRAWRQFVLDRTPSWFPVAVRLGAAGAAGMVAAGAVALVLGLAGSFGDSNTVQTLAAPGSAAGFGMALLGIAYLPNAVIAAAGYTTGVGFHIGAGTYSPFGSSPVELPAVSLLAAAPDGRDASRAGMVLLLIPVVVALLLGRAAIRRLDLRGERLLAVSSGAVIAGLLVAMLAVVAGGGITGGQWSTIGAPPLLFGIVTAVLLGVFGAAIAGAARQSAVAVDALDASDVGGASDGRAVKNGDQPPANARQPTAEGGNQGVAGEDGQATAAADIDPADPATTDTGTDSPEEVAPETAGTGADVTGTAGPGIADTETATDIAGTTDTATDIVGTAVTATDSTGTADTATGSTETAVTATADTGTAAAGPPGTPAPGPVPQARREEDVLAESATPTDSELIQELRPRLQPRQVG